MVYFLVLGTFCGKPFTDIKYRALHEVCMRLPIKDAYLQSLLHAGRCPLVSMLFLSTRTLLCIAKSQTFRLLHRKYKLGPRKM